MALDRIEATTSKNPKKATQIIRIHRSKSGATFITRCHRRGERKSIPKSSLRGPQEGLQREKTRLGYKPPKQIHKSPQVPHGVDEASSTSSAKRRIRCFNRPQGRLLARANTSSLSQILSVRRPGTTVRLQSNAIRLELSSTGVHQADESSSSQAPRSGSNSDHVSGRLAHHSGVSRKMQRNGGKDTTNRKNHGVTIQHEEIQTRSNHADGMARASMEYPARDGISLTGQLESVPSQGLNSQVLIHHLPATVGEPGGLTQPRGRSCSIRPHSDAQANLRRPESIHIDQQRPRSSLSLADQETIEMVDKISPELGSQMGTQHTNDDVGDGRVGRRLGLPIVRRASRSGILEHQLQEEPYQRERAESGSSSHSERTRSQQSVNSHSLRQHNSGPLHKQARLLQVSQSTSDVRRTIPRVEEEENSFIGFTSTREDELLVRRTVQAFHLSRRVESERRNLPEAGEKIRNPRDRSLREQYESETSSVSVADRENDKRGTRRNDGRLEQVAIHLLVPSSGHNSDAANSQSPPRVQGQSTPDCAAMESPSLDANAPSNVPRTTTPDGADPRGQHGPGVHEILGSTRVEFLKLTLGRTLPTETIQDIVQGLRSSTTRQYESSWKKFQRFIRESKTESVSPKTVLEFASYLFHKLKLAISTISGHIAAISDPLKFAYNIAPDSRALELMKSSFFLQRPPKRKSTPTWSVQKVLDHLSSTTTTADHRLKKALFLVALASGLRISQLKALTRSKNLTRFAPDGSQVTLAANPQFIAKNERLHHRMKPVRIPALKEGEGHHSLCPVMALKEYMREVPGGEDTDCLWIWPRNRQALSTSNIAKLIRQTIEEADPGKAPTAHDVRGCASSLAFGRSLDPYQVQEAGQWASCSTFVNRYLFTQVSEGYCVAMGSLPS